MSQDLGQMKRYKKRPGLVPDKRRGPNGREKKRGQVYKYSMDLKTRIGKYKKIIYI